MANTPNTKVASAAVGLVELHGRAVTSEPLPVAISGRPCVWWDVTVSLWYEDSDRNHQWRQVAARYGGRIDVIELEDDTGRVRVWLEGARRCEPVADVAVVAIEQVSAARARLGVAR